MLLTALLALPAAAQDFIHYKFDSTCTDEVVNYAVGPGAFPDNGTLQTNTAAPHAPGRFGNALAGGTVATSLYNRAMTGWIPANQPMNGDITLAFFARQANDPGTSLPYLLGCSSNFRMFTNGAAGNGLIMRNIVASGGLPTTVDCQLTGAAYDFRAATAAGWVHIALVIDGSAGTYTWYADGVQVEQRTGVGPGLINSAGQLQVGYYGTTNESCYDLDEFVLANRAYSPAEIVLLSQTAHAGEGDYRSGIASQCGAGNVTVGSNGTLPQLGNAGYAIRVAALQNSFFVLLPGLTRCSYSGVIPLPFDAVAVSPDLAGCMVVADAVTLIGGIAVTGVPTDLPLPIPANPAYFGAPLFFQALALDLSSLGASMSDGFAIGIGQ